MNAITPRTLAMRAATAVFMKSGNPAALFDSLADAYERAELAEERLREEREHNAALEKAARALGSKGVSPITWSALKRALAAKSGQRDLLAGIGTEKGA